MEVGQLAESQVMNLNWVPSRSINSRTAPHRLNRPENVLEKFKDAFAALRCAAFFWRDETDICLLQMHVESPYTSYMDNKIWVKLLQQFGSGDILFARHFQVLVLQWFTKTLLTSMCYSGSDCMLSRAQLCFWILMKMLYTTHCRLKLSNHQTARTYVRRM